MSANNLTPQRRASFKDHLCISTPNERSRTPTPSMMPSPSSSSSSALDARMTRSMYGTVSDSRHRLCRQSLSFSFSAASDASLATNHTACDEPPEAGFYAQPAAVHPSYQNMMDDQQLIDSCTAAQRDIAALRSPLDDSTTSTLVASDRPRTSSALPPLRTRYNSAGSSSNYSTTNSTSAAAGAVQNAQRLRQWIGYMHKYLDAIAPKRAEVLRMSTFERRVRLAEQSELRKYIASYDRTVKRAAASAQADGADDLEERYLALLLQAIEAQCLLEGYPGMRRVAAAGGGGGYNEDSEDDEGDGALDVTAVERGEEGAESETEEVDNEHMVTAEFGVEDEDDDAASSDFSFEPADRPQTNLRDEILAIVATPGDEVDCCGATLIEDCADDDDDEDNDRTLIAASTTESATAAANVESANAKLTKNMVNRWLQLNLQPPVRWRRPPSLERRTPSRSSRGVDNLETSVVNATIPDATKPVPCPNSNQGEPDAHQLLNTTLSSTTTTSSSPKTDDPVWDGFVQEFQPFEEKSAGCETIAVDSSACKRFDYFEDLESAAIAEDGFAGGYAINDVPDMFRLNVVASDDLQALDFQAPAADDNTTDADDAASLSDSFLLSGPTRRLTMSTLKRIDDIFEVQHATPHRVQWVERRRSSVTAADVAAKSANDVVADAPTIISPRRSPSGRSHSPRTGSNASSTSPSAQQIAAALLQLEQTMRAARTPSPCAEAANEVQENKQRSHRKRRRRNRRAPKPVTADATQLPDKGGMPNITLHDVLVNNIGAMRPDEVQAIVRLCQAHLECLNHVLLCRTVNAIVGQAAMDGEGGGCELRLLGEGDSGRDGETAAQCRCGPIARIVQAMVDFVRDYVNVVRNWRLYRIVVAAVAELYGMAKFVGERVRWHRAQMMVKPVAAIEFVL